MIKSLVEDMYVDEVVATLILSLRIGPTLLFAPPFTYLRIPSTIRSLLCLALAGWLVYAHQGSLLPSSLTAANIAMAAAAELLTGLAFSLSLQVAFSGLLTAGRTLDFQTGFGLAVLADPTLKTQLPLTGTLLVYGAAAVFFFTGGPTDLLAIWSTSLERLPLGSLALKPDIAAIGQTMSAALVLSFGLAGLAILTLVLVDLSIALLSRTLPQMNVLVLGFQVKTLALLTTLPLAISLAGSLFARLVRMALEATPRMLG